MNTAPALLADRLALVTGAGQGNGRAIALGLAEAGARVIATDLNQDTAHGTAAAIRRAGGVAWHWQHDVTDPDSSQRLAAAVQVQCGRVDLLVNNAGIIVREGSDSPRALDTWRQVIDVNLSGVFYTTHAFLDQLKATRGVIVNIASIAAFAGQGASLGYSPSKAGVTMLTRSMAVELAPFGVRVNALAPGVIATPMTEATRADPDRLQAFMRRTPMARVGEPHELVGPVLFLASHWSSYVTGVTLPVDGGFLAS